MQNICVWCDDTWCWYEDLWQYDWKSDDFVVLNCDHCQNGEDVEDLVITFNLHRGRV